MNRRNFLSTACVSCMTGGLVAVLAQGCGIAMNVVNAQISGSDLIVPLSEFQTTVKGKPNFKKHLIVQNDMMKYPICIYRFSDTSYHALLMRCTHQGTELQVFGDKMQCPAHGSEFDNTGRVTNGPASSDLRSFPVTISNNQIKISLV